MSISSISSPNSVAALADAANGTGAATPTVKGAKVLGQEDFLKLLAVQFQSQDPMKPMDDTAFIAQMAQFSSLSQTQTLTQQMTQLLSNQDLTTANGYIGRQVTVDAGSGKTEAGVVSGVEFTDGAARIVVGDYSYPVTAVLSVQAAPVTLPPTNVTDGS